MRAEEGERTDARARIGRGREGDAAAGERVVRKGEAARRAQVRPLGRSAGRAQLGRAGRWGERVTQPAVRAEGELGRGAWCWAGQGGWAALATGLSGKGKGEVGRLGLGFLGWVLVL